MKRMNRIQSAIGVEIHDGRKTEKMCALVLVGVFLGLLSGCEQKETREIQPLVPIPQGADESILTTSSGYSNGTVVLDDQNYYDMPQAGEDYIFALNPGGGSVTVIDAETLTIQVLETGARPTFLHVIEGTNTALVLNTDSNNLSVVRISDSGDASVASVSVVDGANAINVSPDGNYAVVYFNSLRQDLTSEFGDFQTVSVIYLGEDPILSETLSVGFLPRDIRFKADSSMGYVVTDDGVSILDFEAILNNGAGIAPSVQFTSGNFADQTEAFLLTPDGSLAIYKKRNEPSLQMTDLSTGVETYLDFTGFFRLDYDAETKTYSPHWNGELFTPVYFVDFNLVDSRLEAFVIESYSQKVLHIPIPEGITDPRLCTVMDLNHFGADRLVPVPEQNRLLVYNDSSERESLMVVNLDNVTPGVDIPGLDPEDTDTNTDTDSGTTLASDSDTAIETDSDTMTNTDTGSASDADSDSVTDTDTTDDVLQVVPTRKGISEIRLLDNGETALIIHTRKNLDPLAANIPVDERIDRSFGYTLLQTESLDSKLQLVDVLPQAIISVNGGKVAYLLFSSKGQNIKEVQKLNLKSFVVEPPIRLESFPVSGGYVPSVNKIFVNQEHPEGRITFIDVATGELSTVTGFILNSRIKD